MNRRMVLLTVFISVGCVYLTLWTRNYFNTNRNTHITVQPHPYGSAMAQKCIATALPYLLKITTDPNRIYRYLAESIPNIQGVTMRWKNPCHIHITLRYDTPILRINNNDIDYTITRNGGCVSSALIPRHITDTCAQLTWKAHDMPHEHTNTITQLWNNMPSAWWDTYTVIWYNPHDIRLYAKNAYGNHIRTRADRNISETLYNDIQHISYTAKAKKPHATQWIDVRFPRNAIVTEKIRTGG